MNEINQSPAEKYFNFMCHLHERSMKLTERLTFDKKHPWHLNLVSLYCSLIELAGSACVLVKETIDIGVPILLRSAVEAHVDFTNLAADRCYGYRLRATELNEWLKLLKESKNGTNPFLKEISNFPETDKTMEKWKKEKEELQSKGYETLTAYNKFDTANLEPIYRSVYNILCCHSHNNLRALHARHVNISNEKNDFEVELYPPINYNSLLPYIDNFCGILISATEAIHQILQTNCMKEIEELKSEFQKHRNTIVTQQSHSLDLQG